jgi:hypothetical protein
MPGLKAAELEIATFLCFAQLSENILQAARSTSVHVVITFLCAFLHYTSGHNTTPPVPV